VSAEPPGTVPPAGAGPVDPSDRPPREAIADVRIRAPTRGNRKLERLLDAVNADDQVKAWWHVSAVNATRRLGMSDHSWIHIQIVLNVALRLARLLFRRGVVPNVIADYGMSERDAEVVIAAGALFHDTGMTIHRADHEAYSLFLTADKLGSLLAQAYDEPERSIVVAEALHAIIGHRRRGEPFTIEAGIVRVADALDMARGRSRVPFEAGHQNIHSLSDRSGQNHARQGSRRPRRDRDVQQRRHLPGRRAARHQAARQRAGAAHRGHRPHRRPTRETPPAGLPYLRPPAALAFCARFAVVRRGAAVLPRETLT